MKTLQTFVVMPHSKYHSGFRGMQIFDFENHTDTPVCVTVDAFDSLVERQAKEISALKDEIEQWQKEVEVKTGGGFLDETE